MPRGRAHPLNVPSSRRPGPRGKGDRVAAARDVVWDVISDFDQWPSWNPDVRSMSTDGPPAVGSTFGWKAGPGTSTSTIRQLEAPRSISWTGKTLGIKAIDSWHLEPRAGNTLVREEESWDGMIARLFRVSCRERSGTRSRPCSST